MLGLAAVARTRPAWAGTAVATLLNMAKGFVCGYAVVLSIAIDSLQEWSICERAGVGGDVDVMEGRGHRAKRRKFIAIRRRARS